MSDISLKMLFRYAVGIWLIAMRQVTLEAIAL